MAGNLIIERSLNVLRLRAEKAKLLGYENHAAYTLEVQTAQTPQAVNERLRSLAPKSLANAKREASDLQEMINASGESFSLSSWDWDYYTEKVRADVIVLMRHNLNLILKWITYCKMVSSSC